MAGAPWAEPVANHFIKKLKSYQDLFFIFSFQKKLKMNNRFQRVSSAYSNAVNMLESLLLTPYPELACLSHFHLENGKNKIQSILFILSKDECTYW